MAIKVAPSILGCDFGKLNEEVESVASADFLHIDIMDGHFVPNISFGPHVLASVKTDLPLDVHLMISEPLLYLEKFVEIGVNRIFVHIEMDGDVRDVLKSIIEYGVKPGIVLNPETPVETIIEYFDLLEAVLVMSVRPGFGGQKFMPEVLEKVEEIKGRASYLNVLVDGGVNLENCSDIVKSGADIVVAGSYIFNSSDRKAKIESLRNCH